MNLKDFNTDKYVAHYTKFDRVIKDILPFNEIRFSSVSIVNDPYEKDTTWIENDGIYSKEDIIESHKILNELKTNFFNHIKLFCSASYDEASINCFDLSSDIYGKPRMWANYGDNHKGLCLIFDKEELSKEINKICDKYEKLYEDKINYLPYIAILENSISLSIDELKSLQSTTNNSKLLYEVIDKNYLLKSKYFRKHIDWKTENEYRWLIFTKETKEFNVNFGSALKAVVFGVDTNTKCKYLLKDYNIPLFQLSFEYGKYKAYRI